MPLKSEFEKNFDYLKAYLKKLEIKFLKVYQGDPQNTDYELDVKAYCVLAHSAFEEYFESVAIMVMDKTISAWQSKKRKISESLLTLIAHSGEGLSADDNKNNPETKSFDDLRVLLKKVKEKISRGIKSNNGVSSVNLRKILKPVGVDIKNEVNWINSLNKLAEERGSYAHKRQALNLISPEDAKQYVSDCFDLCEDVQKKARKKIK